MYLLINSTNSSRDYVNGVFSTISNLTRAQKILWKKDSDYRNKVKLGTFTFSDFKKYFYVQKVNINKLIKCEV